MPLSVSHNSACSTFDLTLSNAALRSSLRPVENPVKSRKMKIKLPWEVSTVYSEHLRPAAGDEAEDEDEDDIEAHEDSLQRLKVNICASSSKRPDEKSAVRPGSHRRCLSDLLTCFWLSHNPCLAFVILLGCGRGYAANDARRIRALFRVSASFFHLSQGCVYATWNLSASTFSHPPQLSKRRIHVCVFLLLLRPSLPSLHYQASVSANSSTQEPTWT